MRKFEEKYSIKRNYKHILVELNLTEDVIKGSIVHCYETLDMIEQNLVLKGSPKCLV